MTESVIRVEHLSRVLPGEIPVTLVDDVQLEIAEGEFVVITGPSGSGKSSLLYLLGLLDRPTRGSVWLNGMETSDYSDEMLTALRLQALGFVFQFHFLLPEFSALENVMLPMQRHGHLTASQIIERSTALLENFGLREHQHKIPKKLSGGQSQRVAIARALANEPGIIFADEPTGNLDTASSANVQRILKDLAHKLGRTVVVVTHDKDFAKTADRVITIVDGRIVKS